jgi:Fic family protein
MAMETVQRIEPARPEEANEAIADVIADVVAAATKLGQAFHPRTAANIAGLVRIANTHYSNLIEGHRTRPQDIERALAGDLHQDEERRNLQIEAAAHVRLQAEIDRMASQGQLGEPAAPGFLRRLHREFYKDATQEMLLVRGAGREFVMQPGEWRSLPEHTVAVGRHQPPSSDRVPDFMAYFAARYRLEPLGAAARLMAMAAAHHRFNYIHPFPDGNGRVSRLMSHAMALSSGIGAHGLWSISRGLSRGLESRTEYRRMMDHADMPRQGDLDGRGNLSLRALNDFVLWFLEICLDQIKFMSALLEIDSLARRLRNYVERSETLRPEAALLLETALIRGDFERGASARITGLAERSARRVLKDVVDAGLLASDTPKGAVSLRFPADALDVLFPRLFAEAA